MVDVSAKPATLRSATAVGRVTLNDRAHAAVTDPVGQSRKGDVLAVAQIAGIMAAKKTSEIIPLCHPLPLDKIEVSVAANGNGRDVDITATVTTRASTGVEMEALTAVSAAALTVYDMCKALDRSIAIGGVRLLEKTGGASGNYAADDNPAAG